MEILLEPSNQKIAIGFKSDGAGDQAEDFLVIADECAISTERETVFSEYSDRGKNSDDQVSQNSSDIAPNTPIVEETNMETIDIDFSEDETANKIRDRLLAEKRIMFK